MLNMIIQNVDQLLSLPFNEVVKEISNLPHTFDAPEAISKFAKHYGVNPDYLIGRGLYPLLTVDGRYLPLYGKYGEVLFIHQQVSHFFHDFYMKTNVEDLSAERKCETLYFMGKSYTLDLIDKISNYAKTSLYCPQETIDIIQTLIRHSMESLLVTVLESDSSLYWLTIQSIFDDLIANQNNWAQAKALRFALTKLIEHDGILYLRKLLKAGLNVDAQDEKGITLLMIACSKGKDNCIEQLLEFHADIEIEDKEEMNAYDHSSGNTYVHALLNNAKDNLLPPTLELLIEESYQSS